ncbi:hypothetical protein R5R35_007401 [Gryllus longicercus]|uniref:Uncharacterized protein n=1 Tax=Gryllus longicercus TaxID=2509291 RepID=A0AAN9Z288_9ORTH
MATQNRVDGAGALGDAFHQVAQGLARVQEAQRRLQEAMRLQEEEAATALRQMEQQLRQRDNVISTLRRSLDERVLRVEVRMAAIEERVRSASARRESEGAPGQEHEAVDEPMPGLENTKTPSSERTDSEEAGEQGALGRLESRMWKLEGAVQRALATVFPRVEALVERLETSPPGAPLSPSSASTSSAPQPAAARGAPVATEGAAADDVDRLRQQLERRVAEVSRRAVRSRAAPSRVGEALCLATGLVEVRRLLDAGADVNYTDAFGRCPLISALCIQCISGFGDPEVVSLLLARGADPNSIDDDGSSALHRAVLFGDRHCVDLLIAAGADVDARDVEGATPLHVAASYSYKHAIRSLLAAGANKSLRAWSGSYENKTPFDAARTDDVRNLLRP